MCHVNAASLGTALNSSLLVELVDELLAGRGKVPLEQLQLGLVLEARVLQVARHVQRRRVKVLALLSRRRRRRSRLGGRRSTVRLGGLTLLRTRLPDGKI